MTINPMSMESSQIACVIGPSSQKCAKRQFITTKLVAVLDKCKFSNRDATHLLKATAEALGHKLDELIINHFSIHQVRENLYKEQAIQLRAGFQINIFEKSVIHWNGKMLLSLIGIELVEIPVIILSKGHKQLLGVPKLSAGTGEEQAENMYKLLEEWDLNDLVVAICCDTTVSNIGYLKGACVLEDGPKL